MTESIRPISTRVLNGGIQRIFRFPNGYGASVIRHSFSYGHEDGLWELAVTVITGPQPSDFGLCYSTPITNDVLGHLTPEEVADRLKEITELPPRKDN